jgi:phosphoglycerol transferase MdoB-like AlkP superfamily enzyme
MLLPLVANAPGICRSWNSSVLTPHRLWTLVLYIPSVLFPLATRLIVVHRGDLVIGNSAHLARLTVFGLLQDLAVFFQALALARLVLALRAAALGRIPSAAISLATALALALVYLFATLACCVDLALVVNFVPRLNRAFVAMYTEFAGQFASLLEDQLSFGLVAGIALYAASLALWVTAVADNRAALPTFNALFFCEASPSPKRRASPRTHGTKTQRAVSTARCFASLPVRASCVALLASAAALHATLSVDGNAGDIYACANAMFSLETEELVAAALQSSAESTSAQSSLRLVERSGETTADANPSDANDAGADDTNVSVTKEANAVNEIIGTSDVRAINVANTADANAEAANAHANSTWSLDANKTSTSTHASTTNTSTTADANTGDTNDIDETGKTNETSETNDTNKAKNMDEISEVRAINATNTADANAEVTDPHANSTWILDANKTSASTHANTSNTNGYAQTANTTNPNAKTIRTPPLLARLLGANEVFAFASDPKGAYSEAFPLWRKTLSYKGDKRFELKRAAERPPPTIVLLHVESMRSLEVGVLGGRDKKRRFNQSVTPCFDALSQSGVLFRQHYTPSLQTSRTLLSTVFGVLPAMTTASVVSTFAKSRLRLYGLPRILRQAFNYTSMFWSAVDLKWENWRGFLQAAGFEQLVGDKNVASYLGGKAKRVARADTFSWGVHDAVSLDALANYLEAHATNRTNDSSQRPLFLDVYTISSHDPFKRPPGFAPRANYSTYVTKENRGYVDTIHYADQQLGLFIQRLRAKGLLNNTIVLIQGDHGYGRMERGNNPSAMASRLFDEATHIPLLLLADDLLREQDRGLVVDDVTSQTDILATLADIVGVHDFVQHGVGQSLLRKPSTQDEQRGVVLMNQFGGQAVGVRVGDLKCVRFSGDQFEVYNLTHDPLERTPIESGASIATSASPATRAQLRFAHEAVELVQHLYKTNGFVPLLAVDGAEMEGLDTSVAETTRPRSWTRPVNGRMKGAAIS